MPFLASVSRSAAAPLRLLYTGTALLILVLLATNAAVILHLRESELLYQEGQLKNLSLIMAEQADRSFQAVDLVISSVADGLAAEGVTDGASFEQKTASYDFYVDLRERISGVPQLSAVTVISREGKVIKSSRSWFTPEIYVSDRDYFRVLKEDPSLKNYVSEPTQNRLTNAWTVFLVHRMSGANGEFLGLILGAIETRYFEDFYRAIAPREGSSVGIQRLDGVILARFPLSDVIGKVFSSSVRILRGGISGSLHDHSPIDGQMRIMAAHRLTDYPVLAFATKTEKEALENWRGIAWLMSLGALSCAISIALAGFAFGRQWKQQAMQADSQAKLRRQEDQAAAMGTAVSVAQATALQMTHSAEHDFLTDLPNRMLLNDRISQAIGLARRHKKPASVLFLDLDGFKHINDSMGHSVGDKLLQSVARRLTGCVRDSDTVSRQGGDEFVVLLSEMEHSEDAAITARLMLRTVGETHSIDRRDLHITASIGITVYPEDGLDAETLIKNADTAMYQAKENGRQSYQFFEPAMNVRAVERQFIEDGLRGALERKEFLMHYQPIIDLKTGTITGAEALIRWSHPTRGLIPPALFIPIAEDCGLILPIGNWVFRAACQQARTWLDAGLSATTMAVNVSAMQFRDKDFLEGLFAILRETGLDPGSLVLELTESVLMKHAEATTSILRTLRERGIQVAIDDFGTGYSSLGYLRKFPLDALKVDQSFVGQIGTLGEDTTIVTAVIAMARGLKLRVIAEGVETLEQLEFLKAHQCDEVQGYYFSRPVDAERMGDMLASGCLQGRPLQLIHEVL
jgi:diguanylate cyclase (GGDEF)-like protein